VATADNDDVKFGWMKHLECDSAGWRSWRKDAILR
jgi:hypothetical protein